ncbi:MAG TPA: shikimate kinase [Acidimicrobiia bacterium]|nr:shikimate kinase [Acidimicrobiia bacterium]
MTLWLVGMMGSGKSSAGELAAQRLGVPFVDIDEEIVADQGSSIPKLWADSGERAFRELETAAIGRVAGTRAIVSTGGGAVLDPSNRYRMRTTGTVVWLRARPEVLAERLAEAGEGRPMLDDHPDRGSRIAQLLEARTAAYANAADYELDTSELSVEEVAMRIEELWPR